MNQRENKILLIEPPFYTLYKSTYSLSRFPLSLAYLSGMILNKTDWDVMVYNADFSTNSEYIENHYLTGEGFENYLRNLENHSGRVWREVKKTIEEYNPSVVGITAKSQNFASTCIVAKLAKEVNEDILVLAGGPHPSMVQRDVLECPHIDVSVKGEGELTIVELLNAVENKNGFEGVKGAFFKRNGEIIENPQREFIKDLDGFTFPHTVAPRVLKDFEKYPITGFKSILAIRGCPYNCFFCGSRQIWSRKTRFRSPGNIVEEIKGILDMGNKSVHFEDDTFGVNKRYIKDLCRTISEHLPDVKWSCEMHVHLVDDEIISLMKKSGCYSVAIGIESGNNKILNDIRKRITVEEAIEACKTVKRHGLYLAAFFIVGFPQETEQTLKDTVCAMKMVDYDQIIYSIFTPYPGTEAFDYCKENGLLDDSYDVSLYNHQSPKNHFCLNIPKERLRELLSDIEKMIDRRNKIGRIKQIFSKNTLWQIRSYGLSESLKKGLKIIQGK